jgi:phosphohistidine swiveling domain-containing protein
MTKEEIKKKVLEYGDWEHWADRPFGAFILSLMANGHETFKMIGLNWEQKAFLFQNGAFFKSLKVLDAQADLLIKNKIDLFEVVSNCEKFYETGKKRIKSILNSNDTITEKLIAVRNLIRENIAYTWLTHTFEHIYLNELKLEVPKYYQGDLNKFIGDISYPVKKNKHAYFLEALLGDGDLEKIQREFGWIKIRDGFGEPYGIEELSEERQRLKKEGIAEQFNRPSVPDGLLSLVRATQELVYFRTFRTDVLWEFMYMLRPVLREVSDLYKIKFEDLKWHDFDSLISGELKRYENASCVGMGEEFALFEGPILAVSDYTNIKELKGSVAYRGVLSGKVKIVMTAYEIEKVQEGDILVAPTTAPSYIIGMNKASAFITDEGGITSHAAIVAREMKKPCIIGTKIATKVLKDGDLVEVDANQGVVRIL